MSETPEKYRAGQDDEQVKEPYMPTPADEALYLTMLTQQVIGRIQQEHIDDKMDLETYNRLYKIARKADVQAQKLLKRLEEEEKKERANTFMPGDYVRHPKYGRGVVIPSVEDLGFVTVRFDEGGHIRQLSLQFAKLEKVNNE